MAAHRSLPLQRLLLRAVHPDSPLPPPPNPPPSTQTGCLDPDTRASKNHTRTSSHWEQWKGIPRWKVGEREASWKRPQSRAVRRCNSRSTIAPKASSEMVQNSGTRTPRFSRQLSWPQTHHGWLSQGRLPVHLGVKHKHHLWSTGALWCWCTDGGWWRRLHLYRGPRRAHASVRWEVGLGTQTRAGWVGG